MALHTHNWADKHVELSKKAMEFCDLSAQQRFSDMINFLSEIGPSELENLKHSRKFFISLLRLRVNSGQYNIAAEQLQVS